MNRLVEFLHNNEEHFIVLDINGFVAEYALREPYTLKVTI